MLKKLLFALTVAILTAPCAYATDLTITAANVIPASGYQFQDGTAGEAITRGQAVYLKASDSKWWKSQHDGTAAEAGVVGVALQDAGAGQPLRVQTGGSLAFGAILTVGEIYCVSATAGGICPYSDVGNSDYVCLIGVASTTSNMLLKVFASGVAKPAM